MNVQELEGAELDAAVAKAEGYRIEGDWVRCPNGAMVRTRGWSPRKYSTEWAIAGPIIERAGISIQMGRPRPDGICSAHIIDRSPLVNEHGPTPLIAAMRAYVASKEPA